MSFSGKYIAKMFNLKKFLVSKCDFKLLCFLRGAGNQRYVSRKCIHRKIFEQIGIGMAYLHVFFNYGVEVYLKPFQTYLIELFCKNSKWVLALISKKAPS